jgi:hypothetical protein
MSLEEYAARARRRRCPPESVEPRSPTCVLPSLACTELREQRFRNARRTLTSRRVARQKCPAEDHRHR